MRRRIHPEARAELREALAWYTDIDPMLTGRLRQEYLRVFSLISSVPLNFNTRPNGFRRANLNVFPYYIPFAVEDDTIHILAFAHRSRRPNYWIHRTST